ncbi:MAG: thioredoxin family protein [Nitrospirota bacterium]|nr:thioredoxin family protein [Nitrospirota bacterium]MDE3034600.1 thioredoxin family protein [Nitrospirota bacterium]MDE3226097.1 thioredoxin family protein [Nitrospirota bacterium]MDE3243357.1 thioredoxin family protein [Nitrospirota bacterium]
MALLQLGDPAPDFSLPGVDGGIHSLHGFAGKSVLVVIFSCNHCPYVQAYEDRLIELQRDYAGRGVQLVAINSNDDVHYPEDNLAQMIARAQSKGFNFPYLRDASQQVAKAYGATHTPQMFVFDRSRRLRYTGKIDDNWQRPEAVRRRYLREALDALLEQREPAEPMTHAIGCTIKWAP